MPTSIITLNGNAITVVAMPASPGLRMWEPKIHDAVALDVSPFTGQTQTQAWFGADLMYATVTLPPLTEAQEAAWVSFLMQLRGMTNAFQMGDPLRPNALGSGAGTPLVDDTVAGGNAAGSPTLGTKGWTDSASGVLLQGDWIQVNYRLYKVLDTVNADSSGNAVIPIYPTIRELPPDGGPLTLTGSQGLWRLASNDRNWSLDVTRYTSMSFPIKEYR